MTSNKNSYQYGNKFGRITGYGGTMPETASNIIRYMCDVKYDINFIIGTLLYLCPSGSVKITQTGGQSTNANINKPNLKPDQFKTPRHSS